MTMFASSSTYAPLAPVYSLNASKHAKKRSRWHQDVWPGDRLFTKLPQDKSDLIIVFMGVTGAGKSTVINEYLGENVMKVNHGLQSCTQDIQWTTITLPENHPKWPNRRLVLVDTPGFNDTQRGEYEILRKISVWLASVYDNDTKITGLVYLHSIGNVRVGGTALLSHDLFRQICGLDSLTRVVMATTHWESVSAHPKAGQIRESDLKTSFWAETLASGARYMRIEIPDSDINDIVEYILTKQFEAVATQIQEEMVDSDKRVAQTEAGRKLLDTLQRRLTVFQEPPSSNGVASQCRNSPQLPRLHIQSLACDGPPTLGDSEGFGNRLFTADARPDDVILLDMGLSGVGESTFISRFRGNDYFGLNWRSGRQTIDVVIVAFAILLFLLLVLCFVFFFFFRFFAFWVVPVL